MHIPDTLHDWLTLLHAPKLGTRRALEYLRHYGNIAALRAAPVQELKTNGMHQDAIQFLQQPVVSLIERDLLWAQHPRHHILTYADAVYPLQLREINAPPLVLFVSGAPELLQLPQIAIVGSRRPSAAGLRHAHRFATALADYGLTVTSGLALGIDTAAHLAALEHAASTIAVTATGPDRTYPRQNIQLAQRIVDKGATVSEFPCDTPVRARHFPQRNRLISGLAHGVLVVEAAQRSGSLITARLACEQNREVFAIPGSINNPLTYGCHRLIQQGAKLAHAPEDIVAELALMANVPADGSKSLQAQPAISATELLAHERKVLLKMELDAPTTADELVTQCRLAVAEIVSILSALELKGYIFSRNSIYTRLL